MTPEEAINILRNFKLDMRQPNAFYMIEAIGIAENIFKEIQQYREIGTVEECREAVEKQIPKNPVLRIDNGKLRKSCPVCGCFFSPLSRSCPKCGQAILQENKDD